MHGSLMASNSDPGSTSTSKPVQIIKLVKPAAGHTEKFFVSFDGPVKIDFTAIANEQVTYFHDSKNQSLHIIFADGSQAIIEPFFDSAGVMSNLVFEMAPGQILDSAEFTSQFPITRDQSVLPALTEGPLDSGAEFNDPSADSFPSTKLTLLSPEDLSPPAFLDMLPSFVAGLPPVPPLPPTPPSPPSDNNNPFITAAVDQGHTTEDVPPPTASGVIEFTDVDLGDTHSVSVIPDGQDYLGTLTAHLNNDATGGNVGQVTWTFSSEAAALQFLAEGQQLAQTYTVIIADGHGGTAAQLVTITINGTNDAPVVTGAVDNATVTEGSLPVMTADGTIDFGDVDLADAHVTAVTPVASGYLGTFDAIVNNDSTGDGVGQVTWLFAADNELRQRLGDNQQLVQTYTVEIDDGHGGTATQLVTITINGTNDAAVVTGEITGAVVEAGGINNGTPGTPTASGNLNSTDVDDPADSWAVVDSPTTSANGYGTFTIDAAGLWTYTLDNSNAAVEALNVGGTLTDTFTVATIDGTEQVVTITISGTNDAAVISGAALGIVTEAGGVGNDTPGTPTATGDLNASDVDSSADSWTAVLAGAATANGYGTYALNAVGVWTFTLDNGNADVQALNAGDTLTDTFTATTVDGTAQVVTITISGTNDAAVISGTASGNVTEASGVNNGTPGTPIATGDLNASDVDNTNDTWTAVGTATTSTSGYGTYTVTAAGLWTYTLDNTNAAVEALNVGGTLTDTFTVATIDGTPQVVTVIIHGSNDAAVITGTASGNVTEAGGVNNGMPGTPTATGDLNASDVDNPADAWTAVGTATASANGYGTFMIDAAGVWTYALDNSNTAVQALNVGGTLTDSFTVATVDGAAQEVSITITGTNDAAVISGTASGNVTEAGGVANGTPGAPTAIGNLNSTDVDNLADAWTSVSTPTASANGYGTYILTATGVWAYTLDDGDATVQALNIGQTLTDTFTATTVDGTAQLVTITINGANDAAVITGTASGNVTEAGGVNNSTPGTPTTTGDLNASDVDNPADAWTAVGTATASASGYGTFMIDAAGVWTYALDNSNTAVEALNVGGTLTDSFTVATVDGTSQVISITITGANDAAVITGNAAGAVAEAGGIANDTPGILTATGNLNSTDIDNPADSWAVIGNPTASINGYGTFTIDAAGVWFYTLDNSNAAVQALNIGGTLGDSFTVTSVDGTSQLVTITINGANDAAVITGPVTGTVAEAGGINNSTPGTPTATGDLNASDVDNPVDAWTAVGSPTASTNGYGTFTINAAGLWTYSLDNSNVAVQALNVGDTLIDTFTVTTVDGTAQAVTVTINGANDAAVISGETMGSVIEAGGVGSGIPGTPVAVGNLDAADVDNPPDDWTPVATPTPGDNGFGAYTLTAAGVWTYTLDNSNPTVQALSNGATLTDTFTATTVDGTPQVVTVTIHGTDDAAVISGDFTGTVLEAGGVANGTPGIATATGNLDAADVDNPPDWAPVVTLTPGDNGYGSYTLTAAGAWSYTLNDNNPAVQALNAGQTLTDTFTAMTVDGTTQVVTITIAGANDAAVITGPASGSVTEAGGVNNGTPGTPTAIGDLTSTDVDNPNDAWQPVSTLLRGDSGFSTYTLTAAGVWTYTLDDSNPSVQALNVGQMLTDTFTAFTVDGTAQVVTITINGANDAAVISGPVTGTVVEAGGVANATPGTPTATGDLNSTDVDNPADSWNAVLAGAATANGYGTYALNATGVWTYTLDNSNATIQALNVGQTLIDTFTASTVDGTQEVVTITIDGSNDAAVITGDTTGSVAGAGGVANGTPGTSFVVGNLDAADVDNTSDSWTAIETPTLSANGYGTFTVDAAGQWVFILDNTNAAVQALNVGDTLSDTFTTTTVDGTSQLVTITITGANDTAVINGPVTGTVLEAGGVNNGTPGTPTATGDFNSTDVDNTNDAWTAVGTAAASVKGYGTYTLTAAGVWTYTLDDSNATVQALNVGDTLTDRFVVTTIDGTSQLVTITIDGMNDAAAIIGDATGTVIEAGGVNNGTSGIPVATGHLNSIDVDNPDDAWDAVGTSLRGDSSLGTYTLTAGGVWTYTLDNSNAAVQALNAGQTLTDTFTATTVDGTAQLVTITISGANDAAVISGTVSGSVTEAGGVANGTPGTPTTTGDLNSTDVDNLGDMWTAIGSPIAGDSGFGSYTLTASGVWTYALNNNNAAVQALNVGDTLTDSFTATTVDGTSQLVTITINGTNDAAVIGGQAGGSVMEAGDVANGTPGIPIATGDLNSTDVDNADDTWDAVGTPLSTDNDFGTYTLTAAGLWVYTLNNSNAAVQALNAGQMLTDTFTATTVDGTQQLVTVTINGANDAAVISGVASGSVTEAGEINNGAPGTPTATGDLNAADADNPSDAWTAVSSPAASAYGAYTMTAAGVWTYTLNNSNTAVEALNVGDTLTDSFTVTTVDGTAQVVTITINGANDAAVTTGVTSGDVVEAGALGNGTPGTPIATGNLNSIDVDNPSDAWTAVGTATASTNGYGAYTISAAGLWVYTLDNNNGAVQTLNVGQTLTDTFTVTTIDGTAQLVTITINGVNDTAVITGPVTGTVVEAGGVANATPGTPAATGNLNSTDIDNPNDAWTAVNSAAPSANGFGSYTLTADGVWVYTLNNSNPAVQALNVGDTLIDTFTVTTVDGTAQLVTVTINGANDAAVISGATTGSVIEEGGVGSGIPGVPVASGHLDANEVDNPPDDWTTVTTPTPGDSGYGTYTLTAAGVWTYTLDNSNAAVQALSTGDTLTDTFTATTVDGTAQVVTITIHGTDDAAVISGDFTGTVLEAGGVANGTPGIATATGALNAADADSPPDWTPVVTLTPGDNGFGSYTLTAAGVWTYTLDDSNATVQALNPDTTLTDTFTARTVDGTTQLITVTIHGANDAAIITGPVIGTVVEAGGVANGTPGTPTATGDLTSTDVDNPNDAWEPDGTLLRGDSGFSTYTVTAAGVWTYTLDNNNPAVQALNVGQTLTDTLTAVTVDGTTQVVTITINGANDAAVISGPVTGTVVEAGGVANATLGTPTATGDLNSTDVDNPADSWNAVLAGAATANGYGTYALNATGVWTYTLNNSNATVQALNAGQTLTDTFTAMTVDGTQQLVTITIAGTNDAAVISGAASASVTEAGGVANGTPGTPTAIGDLNSTDVDNPNDLWQPVGTLLRGDSGFSTYTLTAAGVWTYMLDDSNAAVQALNVGQTLTDTFTAFTVDGTAQVVTITIHGANDAAVITGKATGSVIEAGGVANGTPGTPITTGDLNSTDVDNPNDAWTAASSPTTSGFGSYTLTATGVWTYTLNNTNATVQALNVGQTLTDTFTATTVDGSAQLVTITINGANDAAVISGPASGSVAEAGGVANGTPGNPTATGNLNSTDVDNPSDAWTTVGSPLPTNNGYGSYTLTAAGVWTYTLNNSNAAVQALNVGQTLTDTFTATTVDGTAQLVTVTINGTNDAAVISGAASGSVTEAGEINFAAPGKHTATGSLNSPGVDNPSDAWTAVSSPAASASGFGSYTLTAAGVWTYTLNNSNTTVQALNAGQTLTDTFTATTVDGTAKVVTITINGSNDTPAAAADNNAADPVTESGVNPGNTPFAGDPSAAGNVLTNDLDVDSGDTKTVVAVNGEATNVGKALVGTYGTLTLLANGSWSYALDNADPDTNALAQGQTASDVFTYTMADASGATSSASLTISITGTNDAPDIVIRSGDNATANLTETGTGLTTNGTLTVTDPDLTNTVTASVSSVALSGTTGGLTAADVLGMLSVTSGSLTADPGDTHNLGWAFNSGAQTFNFLNSGDTLTLAYAVQATDGSASDAQTVTVTIAGTGGGPAAHDDNILVSNSTTVIIPWSALLANDGDPNATITSVTSLNGVTGGTIPVFNLGFARAIIFTTPDTNDLTGNTFTYTISNGAGTSTATVNVGVMQVNTGGNDNPDLSARNYDFSYLATGDGKDKFIGGPGTDDFFGGAGNDTYQFSFTGGGNDLINESILGGAGSDIIQITTPVGASFTDLNFQRVDAKLAGSTDDLLITYNGQSITVISEFSATAADQIETMSFNGGKFAGYSLGTGPYTINTTTGGNDIVAGTSSDDSLNGGSGGNDLIFAGAGNDTVDGGNGDDLLVGGTGNDTLFGGGGNDTYLFALNDGLDTINENGGGGNDQITIMANGAALSSLNFLDSVVGLGGNLVIDYNGQQITVINQFAAGNNSVVEGLTFFGGASYLGYDLGSSTYTFGSGANSIQAGDSAANTMSGGLGRDLLFGNAGNDTITGGGGTDLLVGGAGNDTVTGGTGDDVLVGGTGNDILTGGGGNNRYVFAESGAANLDTITDHSTKDIVDLSPLLDSHFGPSDNPADFARVVQNGSDVLVQADVDGAANGQNFATVAVLSGYGTAGADLVHVLFGNTTHDMTV